MLKFDFNTYVKPFINEQEYNKLLNQKNEVLDKFNHSSMIGWTKDIDPNLIEELKDTANYIKNSKPGWQRLGEAQTLSELNTNYSLIVNILEVVPCQPTVPFL